MFLSRQKQKVFRRGGAGACRSLTAVTDAVCERGGEVGARVPEREREMQICPDGGFEHLLTVGGQGRHAVRHRAEGAVWPPGSRKSTRRRW